MWKWENGVFCWLKWYLKVLRHKRPWMLTDWLSKTGKLCSGSSTLSDRTDKSSVSVFFKPNLYCHILHVKSVQNMEIPHQLPALTRAQVMACRQLSAKKLPAPMLVYYQLKPQEQTFAFLLKKMHLKITSAKCQPFCSRPKSLNQWWLVTN